MSSELLAGIFGGVVTLALTTAVDVVRSGIRARRHRRLEHESELVRTLDEVVEDLRELQGAVFVGLERRRKEHKS